MSSIDAAAVAVEALAWVSGRTREECARSEAELGRDLGLDSLSLLELVVTL
ncbi:hypothetical protein [Streptomyces sp. NPDC002133]|uniref:hypothetical protein n=1 Tax=Streptomyces sp. NPDC002133 TaxID=3154409 RepID=UPI00331D3068